MQRRQLARRRAGSIRQRASGRRRSTPRPEQGASSRTRSKDAAGDGRRRPSAATGATERSPSRRVARVHQDRAGPGGRRRRPPRRGRPSSPRVRSPSRPALRPTSSTRSPGRAPSANATAWLRLVLRGRAPVDDRRDLPGVATLHARSARRGSSTPRSTPAPAATSSASTSAAPARRGFDPQRERRRFVRDLRPRPDRPRRRGR